MKKILLATTLILSSALAQSNPDTLLFLGPSGTYSDAAAQNVANVLKVKTALTNTITDVATQVGAGKVTYGLLPIENSIGGYVAETSTILSKTINWRIIGITDLTIDNTLLVKPGTKASDITTIVSHPQPFLQSEKFLKDNYPNVKRVEAKSTAAAAEAVSKSAGNTMAAIAAPAAAAVYGLVPLAERIQDDKTNTTRFLVITNKPFSRTAVVNRAVVSYLPQQGDLGIGTDMLLSNLRRLGFRPTGFLSTPRSLIQSQKLIIFLSANEGTPISKLEEATKRQIGEASLIGAYTEKQ